MSLEKLADLIFPDVTETTNDLEKKYPARNLKEGAEVTRFAPSPTGFLHTGALFTSLIDKRIAEQSGGIFMLRIEDTDRKREIEGSIKLLTKEMQDFNISPMEGAISDVEEIGNYGPYTQSKRAHIYKICAKELIKKGRAYPCFCTTEELNKLRDMQEFNKMIPGYYGTFARCRNNTVEEMIRRIEQGDKYVIRFRSNGSHMKKITFSDRIRGKIEMADNDQDIVIIKSDGLPTYHFAHAVDDHFMRVTLVIRGEEWIPSTALHIELFKALEFDLVSYAHVPTIMKNDNGSRRKLSKRKDSEAAVSYFQAEGYPVEAVLEYLLTIINSDYELWRKQHEDESYLNFEVKLSKLNSAGALFDIVKLIDVSKNVIAKMTSAELLENVINWSKIYDQKAYDILIRDLDYSKKILGIERDGAIKIRKDFAKYGDIYPNIIYFFNDLYLADIKNGYNFDTKEGKLKLEDIKKVITKYIEVYNHNMSKEEWFDSVKLVCDDLGYASNMKEYKQEPEKFKGSIADITSIIRVALTNKKNTPDIYAIQQVLGKQEVIDRLINVK